jgi:hypothetical protein
MATTKPKNDSALIVDLHELQLPQETLDRIAKSVQKAVMLELATVDEAPDFQVQMSRPNGKVIDIIKDLGRTRGLMIQKISAGEGQ